MEYKHLQNIRWFKSNPTSIGLDTTGIDTENGILRDVVMVEEGEAKGHGVFIEGEFIENIVKYDQRRFAKTGLKARFGHPSASSQTMGTQMGVFSNFRLREKDGKKQGIADLQLLDSAELSPTHPGMKSWALSMAAERPDFMMSSIVFKGSGYYQRRENGNKERMKVAYGPDGPYFSNYDESNPLYIEFDPKSGADHYYTDLVEAGAATENLFSNQANPDFFVSRAHEFLDDNPDILQFVKQHPTQVQEFLSRLGIPFQHTQPKKMNNFSFKKWLFGEQQEVQPIAEDPETQAAQLNEAKEAVTALSTAKDALENRVNALTSELSTAQANVESLTTANATLTQQLATANTRITELEKEPAADHTTGKTETEDARKEQELWHQNPVNQRAAQMRAARKK